MAKAIWKVPWQGFKPCRPDCKGPVAQRGTEQAALSRDPGPWPPAQAWHGTRAGYTVSLSLSSFRHHVTLAPLFSVSRPQFPHLQGEGIVLGVPWLPWKPPVS